VEITVVYKGILLGEIVGDVLPGEDGPHGVKRLLAENFSAVAAKIFELADGRFWAEITCSVENLPDRGQTPCNKPAPSAPPVLQYDKVCGAVVFRRGDPDGILLLRICRGT
jgi:hypothetical protein